MESTIVSQQILTLLIVLMIGYLAKKTKLLDEIATKKLATLLMYVTLPALIFSSFLKEFNPNNFQIMAYVAAGSGLYFLISILFAEKVYFSFIKKDTKELNILKASSIFSNSGYMGIPLINELYGSDGVFYVSIYIVASQILTWTYGITLYSGQTDTKSLKKLLVSPSIISILVGLIVYLLQIPVHISITNSMLMIGKITTPIAMMIIGSNMANLKFKNILSGWMVYYVSFIKLILVPTLFLIAVHFITIPSMATKILVTALAMPVAVNVAVFAEKFGNDSQFASKAITLSTILSMITIPTILRFL